MSSSQVAVQPGNHEFTFLIGELEADHRFSVNECLDSDWTLLLLLLPKHGWKRGGPQPNAGEVGHETPTIYGVVHRDSIVLAVGWR